MRFHDLRTLQGQANAAHAEERVFFFGDRPIRQRFVAADIERAHYQRAPGEAVEDAAVFGFLRRLVRRLRVGHENQFGAQQANAFGALLDCAGHTGAFADVGEHLDGMTVGGVCRLMALFGGNLQALLTGVALFGGTFEGRSIGVDMQAPTLAVEQ